MKYLPFLLLMIQLTTGLSAREWTNTAGKKIEAELLGVKNVAGSEVAVLKVPAGQTYDVPLSQLSAADQEYARQAPPAGTAAAPARPSVFKEVLKGKLVAVNGGRVTKYEMTDEPKYYAFYFTASWCPPCRGFTPSLVDFYTNSEGKKKDFEIIMVSRDEDEKSMEEYMKSASMPWPAITFRSTERMEEIQKYKGRGIPCLVLVDGEGNVLSHSYEGETYLGPTKVMNDIAAKIQE